MQHKPIRLTRRGKITIAVVWVVGVLLINYALRDWNWYGGFH